MCRCGQLIEKKKADKVLRGEGRQDDDWPQKGSVVHQLAWLGLEPQEQLKLGRGFEWRGQDACGFLLSRRNPEGVPETMTKAVPHICTDLYSMQTTHSKPHLLPNTVL